MNGGSRCPTTLMVRGRLASLRPTFVDVETRGELTRGMSVIDARPSPGGVPNVDLAVGIDVVAVRDYIGRILRVAT